MIRVKIEAFDLKPDERGYANEVNRREIGSLFVDEGSAEKLVEFVALTIRGTVIYREKGRLLTDEEIDRIDRMKP